MEGVFLEEEPDFAPGLGKLLVVRFPLFVVGKNEGNPFGPKVLAHFCGRPPRAGAWAGSGQNAGGRPELTTVQAAPGRRTSAW